MPSESGPVVAAQLAPPPLTVGWLSLADAARRNLRREVSIWTNQIRPRIPRSSRLLSRERLHQPRCRRYPGAPPSTPPDRDRLRLPCLPLRNLCRGRCLRRPVLLVRLVAWQAKLQRWI